MLRADDRDEGSTRAAAETVNIDPDENEQPDVGEVVIFEDSRFNPPEELLKFGGPSPVTARSRKPTGIMSSVVKAGTYGGVVPRRDSEVTIHHIGWRMATGEMFDSSYLRGEEPETYRLSSMIDGLIIGIQDMKENETRRIWVPATRAYGYDAYPEGDLVYEIELFKVEDPPPWGLIGTFFGLIFIGEAFLFLREKNFFGLFS